ncbi:outer membrane lipid asymmetry maintenance protein MlaD [Pacificimonas sp. ICDLI1SI03]
MNQLFRQNLVEALIGAGVLFIAIVAALVFYQRTSAQVGEDMYEIAALFENAAGVAEGTDVRVSGITVGSVVDQSLEGEFPFRARLQLAIDDRYHLPADSSASITSEGILGGNYIALTPGGDPEELRDGDEILDTQGSVDMLGLIGSYINNSGESAPAASSGSGGGADDGGFGVLEEDFGAPESDGLEDDSL